MDNILKINDETLDQVTGGKLRKVYNATVGFANLRESPSGRTVGRVYNGEFVNTTGVHKRKGDYDWYEVSYDGEFFWIAGSLIGL